MFPPSNQPAKAIWITAGWARSSTWQVPDHRYEHRMETRDASQDQGMPMVSTPWFILLVFIHMWRSSIYDRKSAAKIFIHLWFHSSKLLTIFWSSSQCSSVLHQWFQSHRCHLIRVVEDWFPWSMIVYAAWWWRMHEWWQWLIMVCFS